MKNFVFKAIDEKGNSYPFDVVKEDNILKLTLKKELFSNAKKLRALGEFTRAKVGEDGYYLQPRDISIENDFLTKFKARNDTKYLHGDDSGIADEKMGALVLSCFGVKKQGLCALVRIERNYHYMLETQVENGEYTLSVLFSFDGNDYDIPYDDIRIEVVLLDENAGYSDIAKAEREIRLNRGEIEPLSKKCEREAVEYARKYPLLRIRMGWKPSPSKVFCQTEENEPEMLVACDFKRVRDIADELERQGVKGVELQLVGWNKSGHDGCFPQLFPADERFGGDEGLKETINYVKSKGYKISLHTNLIDAVELANTFTWDDICIMKDGNYKFWSTFSGGHSYSVCMEKQVKNNRRDTPSVADLGLDGIHFTDVISILVPKVCHSKIHPSSTGNGIKLAQQIIAETKDMMGAFSSEGALDFAIGGLDYALYLSFGKKDVVSANPFIDEQIPFFQLIYHGILLYNPSSTTVNYPIKPANERLSTYLLGGRPTLYIFSKFGETKNWMGDLDLKTTTDEDLVNAVKAIKSASEEYLNGGFHDRQLVYMKDYQVLENGLEACIYEDGVTVVANYDEDEKNYKEHIISAKDYKVIKE